MQGLLALTTSGCSPPSWSAKVALSPFYALGERASVGGNVGLCVLAAAVQLVATGYWVRFGGLRLRAAMSAARAPQWAHRVWQGLHVGTTKASLELLRTVVGAASDAALGAGGLIFNALCIGLLLQAHRTVLRAAQEGEEKRRWCLVTRRWPRRVVAAVVPGTVRWAMPRARWKPDAMRRQYGSLVSPFRGERRRSGLYVVAVPTVAAVLGAAVPWCEAVWWCSFAVMGGAAVFVGVSRPHRAALTNVLQVVSYTASAGLCFAVGAGVTSADVLGALTLLQSAVSLLRAVHLVVVIVMEERMNQFLQRTEGGGDGDCCDDERSGVVVRKGRRMRTEKLLVASVPAKLGGSLRDIDGVDVATAAVSVRAGLRELIVIICRRVDGGPKRCSSFEAW